MKPSRSRRAVSEVPQVKDGMVRNGWQVCQEWEHGRSSLSYCYVHRFYPTAGKETVLLRGGSSHVTCECSLPSCVFSSAFGIM